MLQDDEGLKLAEIVWPLVTFRHLECCLGLTLKYKTPTVSIELVRS